jgi:c-di-GMP-binding flagellar brake protein YcgR
MAVAAERRQHIRFEVPCRVRFAGPGGEEVRSRTLNVSDGGALLPAPLPVAVGEALHLHLAVPRETANTFFLEQFAVRARVVRHVAGPAEGPGIAVQFERPLRLDLP